MLPIIFSLGPIKIYSMGLLLGLGLFFGLYYWWKLGRDEHFEETALFDAFFLALIAFLVVGRVGYVAMHVEDLGTFYRLLAFLRYPGISYSIGIVGAIVSISYYAKAKMWELAKMYDAGAVALSLIIFLGTVGAFLNGSNPGKEGWGMVYPGTSSRHFPVDLLGATWYLITFAVIVRVRKNFRFYSWYKGESSVAKDGLAALIFVVATGIYYVIMGFVDDNVAHLGVMPYISVAGILVAILGVIIVLIRSGREYRLSLLQFIRRRFGGEK